MAPQRRKTLIRKRVAARRYLETMTDNYGLAREPTGDERDEFSKRMAASGAAAGAMWMFRQRHPY